MQTRRSSFTRRPPVASGTPTSQWRNPTSSSRLASDVTYCIILHLLVSLLGLLTNVCLDLCSGACVRVVLLGRGLLRRLDLPVRQQRPAQLLLPHRRQRQHRHAAVARQRQRHHGGQLTGRPQLLRAAAVLDQLGRRQAAAGARKRGWSANHRLERTAAAARLFRRALV